MAKSFVIKSTTRVASAISIGNNGLRKLSATLKEHYQGSRLGVITDSNVAELYHDKIKSSLPDADIFVVEAGEKSKSMKVAETLCGDLLEEGYTRDSVIVGLGGGMVTDLAGFVASVYMRGVPFIAVPTTLLAMIDASVGGKTGVNLEAKNIIGTFYPAERVLVDSSFLKTLPEREIWTGMAEAIKYAAVLDASLEKVLMAKKTDYQQILEKCIGAKVKVCNEDLKEGGLRKILNFGHTLGHGVEYLSHYKLTHGEAISIGMVLANQIAQKLGKQTKAHGDRVTAMLKRLDLPTELPNGMKLAEVIGMVYRDKKMEGQKVSFILSTEMGQHEIVKLTPSELTKLLK